MNSVLATFQNGQVELSQPVDWREGTLLEVAPLNGPRNNTAQPMNEWPDGFFNQLRQQWGYEPFERAPQGESEQREEW